VGSSTGVPPVSIMGVGTPNAMDRVWEPFPPMNHRQDADATRIHGQDARATGRAGLRGALGADRAKSDDLSHASTRRPAASPNHQSAIINNQSKGFPPPELLLYGPAPPGDAVPRPLTCAAFGQKHGSREDFMAVFRTSAYSAYHMNPPTILQKMGTGPLSRNIRFNWHFTG
jgi:hypothetical protein